MAELLRRVFFFPILCLTTTTSCIDVPEFAIAFDGGSSEPRGSDAGVDTDAATGSPDTPAAPPATASPPANDAGTTPPPPEKEPPRAPEEPPPPPKRACPAIGVCCGTVACVGCSNAESGDCVECEKACHPGEICCKKGGPPRCRALDAKGKGNSKGKGNGDDKDDDDDC